MRVTFFGMHPDDIELGCGGTVALCADSGHQVFLVDLTRGESSSNGTPETRAAEAEAAAAILGCRERLNLGLPDTGIVSEDGEQQRAVVDALRVQRPDLIVMPNGNDPHPDHASGARLIERAMYLSGIHGYTTASGSEAWKIPNAIVYSGRLEVDPNIIVDTSDVFARKMKAIEQHRSQFGRDADSRPTPLNARGFLTVIEARDRATGHRIGVQYGEAFRAIAPIAVADLGGLFGGHA